MTRPSRAPIPRQRAFFRLDDRSVPVRTQGAVATAMERTGRLGLSLAEYDKFMDVFHLVREMDAEGTDHQRMYDAAVRSGDDLWVAAYHEAVASLRTATR